MGYHSGLLVGGPPGASDTPEGFSPNRPASWGAPHQLSVGGLRVGPGARSVAPTVSAPPSKLLSGKKTDSGKKDFRALQVREHAFCLSFKRNQRARQATHSHLQKEMGLPMDAPCGVIPLCPDRQGVCSQASLLVAVFGAGPLNSLLWGQLVYDDSPPVPCLPGLI